MNGVKEINGYMKAIFRENCKVGMLAEMLSDNVKEYCVQGGGAGFCDFPKNHNASKTAILNQITTLRNELLVLAEEIKK